MIGRKITDRTWLWKRDRVDFHTSIQSIKKKTAMDCPVNPSDSQVRILDFDFPTSLFMERVLPINLSVSESYELARCPWSPGFRERIIIKNLLNIFLKLRLDKDSQLDDRKHYWKLIHFWLLRPNIWAKGSQSSISLILNLVRSFRSNSSCSIPVEAMNIITE